MSTIVRDARPDDVPWLVAQLLEFLGGTGLPLHPSADHARQTVGRLIAKGVVLVAEHPETGERLGTIGGTLDFHLFDPEVLVLAELWWWVAPAHRRSTAGLRLLEAFRERGLQDVDLVTMSTLTSTHPGIAEHLERWGFRPRETAYLLDVAAVLSARMGEKLAGGAQLTERGA